MKPLKGFRTSLTLGVLTAIGLTTSQSAQAALINFEHVPGAYQGLPINTQFAASDGVTFSFKDGNSPLLAEVGTQVKTSPSDPTIPDDGCFGFYYSGSSPSSPLCDTAAPLYEPQLGQWFLTDSHAGVVGVAPNNPLIITYTTPVSAASGQIWDIDGTPKLGLEGWKIEALDQSNHLLPGTVSLNATLGIAGDPPGSQPPYPGDGVPSAWSFDYGEQALIKSIQISYTGSKSNVGLAFDNFNTNSPTPVPEPGSMIDFLAIGAFGVGLLLKRKKLNGQLK